MSNDDFSDRVERFFAAHCKPRAATLEFGVGDDVLVGSAFREHPDEAVEMREACAFQRALFEAGFAWTTGPSEWGGAAFDADQRDCFRAVARRYRVPDLNGLIVGQQIVAPAVLAHGTDEQRAYFLPAIWSGAIVACQLFSEPGSGSDLASIRTKAVPVPGGWRVNGQKVWSSGAHLSHVGELLVRTSPDPAERHRGLSIFMIDMASPGITVRPIRQMNGSAHFCEVFLDDVFVPDDAVLGAVGAGWTVANTSLRSERDGFGDDATSLFIDPFGRLLSMCKAISSVDDSATRQGVADAYIRDVIASCLPLSLEGEPEPVATFGASIVKLFCTDANRRLADVAADVLGPAIAADTGEWGTFSWSRMLLGVPATRIAGGTDEIQLNILAERVLGLPREPKP